MSNSLSLLQVEGSLDVSDVLSVVTSRAETRLHTDLNAAKKAVADAEATVRRLDKEASDQWKSEHRAAGDALAAKLRPAIESVGGKVKVSRPDHWKCERRELDQDGNVVANVSVVANDGEGGYNRSCVFDTKVPASDALRKLEESVEAAKKDVEARKSEALSIRKKLANVPVLERRARARLAEAKLGESEDGRAVLAALTDEFEADFLALPGN